VINLVLALLAALLIALPVGFLINWLAAVFPALFVAVLAYVLLARRTGRSLQALRDRAELELKDGRIERAVAILESGYRLQHWQFLMKSQIDAQIGAAWYLARKWEKAEPYLANSVRTDGMARGMYACILFKRHRLDEATKALEEALKLSGKQAVIWGLYAYLLAKANRQSEAIEVLNRGLKKLPDNDALKTNLLALQNGQKMKTKPFGDSWYLFGLDMPTKQSRTQQFRPRASRVSKKLR
jgi:tetratricopeptide (TPR) repeat protein